MLTLLFAALLPFAILGALLFALRRDPLTSAQGEALPLPAPATAAITDPRGVAASPQAYWQLRACDACALTRITLHGKRFATAEAIPLPTLGCHPSRCRCHYTPVLDQRDGTPRRPTSHAGAAAVRAPERRESWLRRRQDRAQRVRAEASE